MIKNTERNILILQKNTEDALSSFCPNLTTHTLSLIWKFATTEEILSTKLTCRCIRLLNEAVEDWGMKSLSTSVLKIIEVLEVTRMDYTFEIDWKADYNANLFLQDVYYQG